jgi:hypothetical protein
MPASGVIWFDLIGLWPRGKGIFSFSVNHSPFLHQLSNELADGGITNIIIHSVWTYGIIIIHTFLLVIEMQMCGRVIFGSTKNHFFDPNSAARRVLGLNSLLTYAMTLYYLALEYQPLVVIASMRSWQIQGTFVQRWTLKVVLPKENSAARGRLRQHGRNWR